MEKLVDRLVLLALCGVWVLAGGTPSAYDVAALLACAAASLASPSLPGSWREAPALLACAAALAWPPLACGLPLAAYGLAAGAVRPGGPARAAAAWAPVAVLALAWAGGSLAAGEAGLAGALVSLAALLAARAERVGLERAAWRAVRDDLREAELSLARANRDLLDRQEYEVRLATLAERTRIAREIHDNVGHLLTRAVVQAEAQRVACAGDERAQAGFAAVAATAREALDEVRASVHALRDEAAEPAVLVRRAVEEGCAGTALAPETRIEVEAMPAAVLSCFVAVVREALSNALRHARAARVRVELVEHPGLWRLSVSDDGSARALAARDGRRGGRGMGLASMEERVRELGGTFRAGPRAGGGWEVFASVPKGGDA